MRVTVRLFGPQARLAGRRQLLVELEGDAPTAGEVRAELGRVEPRLRPSLAHSRLAINHSFASDTQRVSAADELALIGMLGGG